MRQLQRAGGAVRVLNFVARDKACVNPASILRQSWTTLPWRIVPAGKGILRSPRRARAAALEVDTMDPTTLRRIALAHQVCPYYLGQELVRWVDVVIADYTHYLDHGGLLHAMTVERIADSA